jgi:hypothetical protein
VEEQDIKSRILLFTLHMYPLPQTGVEAQDNQSNQRAARRAGTQGQSPQRRGSFSFALFTPPFFWLVRHSRTKSAMWFLTIYIYIYIHIHTYICLHIYTYICMYTFMYVCI